MWRDSASRIAAKQQQSRAENSVKALAGVGNSAARRSGRIIRAGFIAVMALIAGISLFSVLALHQAKVALDKIVRNDQLAMGQQFRMLQVARERSVVLYRIITTEDPFEQDADMLRFDELGGKFGEARRRLLELDLDSRARMLLEEQGRQTAEAMVMQREVLYLALSGRREDAARLLVEKAIPAQDTTIGTINELLEHQVSGSQRQAEQLQKLQGISAWLLAAIGVVAMALAAAIARHVRLGMSGLVGELSATAHSLEEANRQMQFQKLAMDQHDIVSITDIHGNITYVNDKFCEISLYSREELMGRNHRILKSAAHPDDFYAEMWDTIAGGRIWKGEVCNRKKDGSLYWVSTTVVPFLDDAGLPYQYVSVRTDITDLKEAQHILQRSRDELEELVRERTAELAEREDLLCNVTAFAHDAIVMLDPDGRVAFWNPAAEEIFGYAAAEIMGRKLHAALMPAGKMEAFRSGFEEFRQTGAGAYMGKTVELTTQRKDGTEIFVEISLSAVKAKGGWHAVGIARDITTRKRVERHLELLAATDPLTGASNRRRFDEAVRTEVARSRRYGTPLSLIMLDIDHFKRINDSLGHPVGDQVLAEFARLISGNVRDTDLFARLGGEEFAVLAANCDMGCARQFAEKLRRQVEAHEFPEGSRLTCSFGVAGYRNDDDRDTLIKRADEALYFAKGEGRNRVVAAKFPPAEGSGGR